MAISNKAYNVPETINGHEVIMYTNMEGAQKMFKGGVLDQPSLMASYDLSKPSQHLGLVELCSVGSPRSKVKMICDFLKQPERIIDLIEGYKGRFTYDIATYSTSYMRTMADTSDRCGDFPGIDESTFEIALSEKLAKNTIITYDLGFGKQAIVSDYHDVRREGEYWVHTMKMFSSHPKAYFDKQYLKPNVQYFVISTHIGGEFGETYGQIRGDGESHGRLTMQYQLGNHISMEIAYTLYSNMRLSSMGRMSDDPAEAAVKMLRDRFSRVAGKDEEGLMHKFGVAYTPARKADGSKGAANVRVGDTMRMAMVNQLTVDEAKTLMWQKGGVIKGVNGLICMNEGLHHQCRRGWIVTYNKELKLEHLQRVKDYIFRNSDLDDHQKRMKLKGGKLFMEQFMLIKGAEALRQMQNVAPYMSNDSMIKGAITTEVVGDTIQVDINKPIFFRNVNIAGLGNVDIDHDPCMDYLPYATQQTSGHYGKHNYAWTSYNAVIWDKSSDEYSNAGINTTTPRGSSMLKFANGDKARMLKNGVYYIRPEGGSFITGYENGRGYRTGQGNVGQTVNNKMGRTDWAHVSSAAWIPDPSCFVAIERKRSGVNTNV